MDTLTPDEAGARLGITGHAVRNMIAAGRLGNLAAAGTFPFRIPADDVARVQLERRATALRKVGDETAFARQIHQQIWPNTKPVARANGNFDPEAILAHAQIPSGRAALRSLPANAAALWGPDMLAAAATKFSGGACRTCFARDASRVHGTFGPRDDEVARILLGNPCGQCVKAFATQERAARRQMQQLRQNAAERRDSERLAQFDAQQRAAMAQVQKASAEFARIVKLRKAAGMPPLGGKR